MNVTFRKRALCALVACCLLLACVAPVAAEPAADVPVTDTDASAVPETDAAAPEAEDTLPEYSGYLEERENVPPYSGEAVLLDGADATVTGGQVQDSFEGRTGVAKVDVNGTAVWTVPAGCAEGLYALRIAYASQLDEGSEYLLRVLVNGQPINRQASLITLPKIWIHGLKMIIS